VTDSFCSLSAVYVSQWDVSDKDIAKQVTYDFHTGKCNLRWWDTLNTHKWFFKIVCIFELADWLHVVVLLGT
jgi:hypothetical protein